MADYKRLITYAYNYESGTKKQNVGHARVEVFGNELKVKVNIKVPNFSGNALKLYFYKRIRGGLKVTYLCEIPVTNGLVDEKVQTVTSHIGDSGLEFHELDGFILYYNPTKCVVSDWNDTVLTSEELYSIESLKTKKASDEATKISQIKPISEQVDIVENEPKDLPKMQDDNQKEKASEVISDSKINNELELELENNLDSSKSSELDLFKNIASKIVQNINKLKDLEDSNSETEAVGEKASEEFSEQAVFFDEKASKISEAEDSQLDLDAGLFDNTLSEQSKEDGVLEENGYTQQQKDADALNQMDENAREEENEYTFEQEYESALDQEVHNISGEFSQEFLEQELMNASEQETRNAPNRRTDMHSIPGLAAATTGVPIENQGIFGAINQQAPANTNKIFPWRDTPEARKILNGFPRVYPFEDGEIAECVKIEPKDIGLLPMEHWGTGNNSFLLHGYNNYHHLLFAKKQTRNGCLYLLMVPGVYNAREKYMARLFGFEYFKSAKRRNLREGEFGYWYLTINF